jgi:hypothetical protein
MGPKIRVIHALDLGPPAHPYENIFLYESQLSNIRDDDTVTSGIPREMNSAKRYKVQHQNISPHHPVKGYPKFLYSLAYLLESPLFPTVLHIALSFAMTTLQPSNSRGVPADKLVALPSLSSGLSSLPQAKSMDSVSLHPNMYAQRAAQSEAKVSNCLPCSAQFTIDIQRVFASHS